MYGGWPVFVTTDVAYHEWHQLFDKILRDLEQNVLLPKLEKLVSGSIDAAHAQSLELARHAARRRRVARRAALRGRRRRAQHARRARPARAEGEGADRRARRRASTSPLLGVKVDYSLFTPRGHYTRTAGADALLPRHVGARPAAVLPARARSTARGTEPARHRDPRRARRSSRDPELVSLWHAIYEPTAFLVGRSDDYTPLEVAAAAKTVDPDVARRSDAARRRTRPSEGGRGARRTRGRCRSTRAGGDPLPRHALRDRLLRARPARLPERRHRGQAAADAVRARPRRRPRLRLRVPAREEGGRVGATRTTTASSRS